jgi:hypothetical protein
MKEYTLWLNGGICLISTDASIILDKIIECNYINPKFKLKLTSGEEGYNFKKEGDKNE